MFIVNKNALLTCNVSIILLSGNIYTSFCFGYNSFLIFEVGFYFWNVLMGDRINNLQNMHTQDISVHLFRLRRTRDILITCVS